MPSGYTANISKGMQFDEFVWKCARAFGALIDMRDEPSDASPPEEFKPNPHYAEKLASLEDEMKRLDGMSAEEAANLAEAEREALILDNEKRRAEASELHRKYRVMIGKVTAWVPPSEDHAQLKEFMIEQLSESIRFDCDPYQAELPPGDVSEWLARKKEEAQKSLSFYHEQYAEELKRVNDRNRWIRELRASVPQPRKAAA
jgi:hypothetical protein